MKTKAKTFDCVEMMHECARRVQEDTRNMSLAEKLAYWNKAHDEMRRPRSRKKPDSKKPR